MTRQRAILLAIILVGFGLRMWQLPQTPPGLWYDEAYNAMDALWMAETSQYPLFLQGNNGREPMWHYLALLSISVLGNSSFAVRLVGSLAGLLTLPVMYRLAHTLSASFIPPKPSQRDRAWFALAATGWLAVSWWHLLNSRAGFRPVLLPPLLMLSLYFFWQGWVSANCRAKSHFSFDRSHLCNFILAGLFLGLAQYTYLPARLAPLIFGGLALLWTGQSLWQRRFQPKDGPETGSGSRPTLAVMRFQPSGFITLHAIKALWPGLLLMALTGAVIFAPLGIFFLNTPAAFFSRTGDVVFAPANLFEGLGHLLQGITLFLGAGHELYRHHLPGRAMLGWLEIPFFWLGLLTLLRPTYLRRPASQLVLLSFGVMWLPALLASPPVHALRPIGLLPFYYLIVTVGLYHAAQIRQRVSRLRHQGSTRPRQLFPLTAAAILIFSGLINTYDYFWRWRDQPEVYQEFNGPLTDLTFHLIDLSRTHDIIIPFHLYAHPTTRYLLRDTFQEVNEPPAVLKGTRPLQMLLVPDLFQLLYVGNIPQSPALVLLTRDKTGQGKIYVSRPPRSSEQTEINNLLALTRTQFMPFKDKLGRDIAIFTSISNYRGPIADLFSGTPLRSINLNWTGLAELQGYDVTPQLAQPGQPVTLNLYWHSQTEATFDYRIFLQLIDSSGNPISQIEEAAFSEDMYRWRPDGILPTQHTIWLGPDIAPGPYLIRLGFFDPLTNKRLPLQVGSAAENQTGGGATPTDQIQLGLFYVTADDTDPHKPMISLSSNFADFIQLTGVSLPLSSISNGQSTMSKLPVTFHWQSLQPTNKAYTVFLQLLNEDGEVKSGWDGQPFDGLYPTTYWSPGEAITDTFDLPLPEAGLAPGEYRLVTGFYDFETGQRLPVAGGADFAELARFDIAP